VANELVDDRDLVVLGDLDEVPDPRIFRKVDINGEPRSLSMLFHYYFMNCQNVGVERWWNGTVVCSGRQFKEHTPQALRDKRNDWKPIPKAGWHFSYLGGLEKIKYKIQSFAHTEFNKDEYTSDENILSALEEGKDIFKREGVKYKFVSTYYYPSFLRKNMLQYPTFIYPKKVSFFTDLFYTLRRIFKGNY
jgi:beta-1,4-mannosyl-glycoprotein beta-1,4-N-acetylglucosaminyltransferase